MVFVSNSYLDSDNLFRSRYCSFPPVHKLNADVRANKNNKDEGFDGLHEQFSS
jgi:hypothetical protein